MTYACDEGMNEKNVTKKFGERAKIFVMSSKIKTFSFYTIFLSFLLSQFARHQTNKRKKKKLNERKSMMRGKKNIKQENRSCTFVPFLSF